MLMRYVSTLLIMIGLVSVAPGQAQHAPANSIVHLDLTLPFDAARGEVVPDTTEPWRYFPLEVGNTWEYLGTDGLIGRKYIERDTIIDGNQYFVFNGRNFTTGGHPSGDESWYPPLRFDTLTAHVVGVSGPLFPQCPFNLPFESTCYNGNVSVGGGYNRLLVFPRPDGADSVYTAVKTLTSIFWEYRFAADFGEVFYYCFECGFGWGLQAARIGGWDGEVYGQLLVPPPQVSSEEPPALARSTILVWPNPFRKQLSVSLTLDEPGPVVLIAYDLLGREMLRRNLGAVPSGEHTVRLETHTLPAGAYLLRAGTGNRSFTSSVLTRVP